MKERVIWWALNGLADGGIKLAAKAAPQLELDIFPHRNLAASRRWWHLDAYMQAAPGGRWQNLCLEFGGWTVDASWKLREELAVTRR